MRAAAEWRLVRREQERRAAVGAVHPYGHAVGKQLAALFARYVAFLVVKKHKSAEYYDWPLFVKSGYRKAPASSERLPT